MSQQVPQAAITNATHVIKTAAWTATSPVFAEEDDGVKVSASFDNDDIHSIDQQEENVTLDIRLATAAEAGVIAKLATALTEEIIQLTGVQHFHVDQAQTTRLCEQLLVAGKYVALLAWQNGAAVGLAGCCESHALYAEGTFGVVQEFYVLPEWRSAGVGAELLAAVADYGRTQAWARLELCTPPLPEFVRSLAFYERNGFDVTGGRKMKQLLPR